MKEERWIAGAEFWLVRVQSRASVPHLGALSPPHRYSFAFAAIGFLLLRDQQVASNKPVQVFFRFGLAQPAPTFGGDTGSIRSHDWARLRASISATLAPRNQPIGQPSPLLSFFRPMLRMLSSRFATEPVEVDLAPALMC